VSGKSRNKGAAAEREVVRLLRDSGRFPAAARELEQYQASLGRDLRGTEPWCLQVKRHKGFTPRVLERALQEAAEAADDHYAIPAVFFRGDRQPWRVLVRLSALKPAVTPRGGVWRDAVAIMSVDDFLGLGAEAVPGRRDTSE